MGTYGMPYTTFLPTVMCEQIVDTGSSNKNVR